MWKLVVKIDHLCDQELTRWRFELGYGEILWPTPTNMVSILFGFLDKDDIRERSFPRSGYQLSE